jgi:hypothetical protein
MAIGGISGYTPSMVQQYANAQRPQQAQPARQDNDGDNDGSRAGEVESNEAKPAVSAGATLGSLINVKA